jgi:hypothetical protein
MSTSNLSSGFYRWVLLFVVLAAAAIGWWFFKPAAISSSGPSDTTAAQTTAAITPTASAIRSTTMSPPVSAGWTSIPGVKLQTPAASFAEALKAYSSEDQQYLKRFNDLTHGLLDFSSREDQQWKEVRGYPTIEEILANRGKSVPVDGKFYREVPLKEAVMAALRIAEAIQEAKSSDAVGPDIPNPAEQYVFGVSRRVGAEHPQSASLAGYLYALSESPYKTGSATPLVAGASLAA